MTTLVQIINGALLLFAGAGLCATCTHVHVNTHHLPAPLAVIAGLILCTAGGALTVIGLLP